MKTLKTLTFAVLLALWLMPTFQTTNPASVYCDIHNAYFTKQTQVYPNGICYDKYSHYYYEDGAMRTHTMLMKCK